MTDIRAIVGRFSFDFSRAAMEKVLQDRTFSFCAILSSGDRPQYFSAIPQSQQQWFISSEVRGCLYRGVDFNALLPIDEELIEDMHECEAMFMNIVYRLEWKRSIPYSIRKQWYLRHLRFWNDYLEHNRINFYLSAWLPHEIPDIIIYYLCKRKDIPVLYFQMSTERDTQFSEHDIEESALQIRDCYEKLLKEYADISDPERIPLGTEFQERYGALVSSAGQKPALQKVEQERGCNEAYWSRVCRLLYERPLRCIRNIFRYLTPRGMGRLWASLQRWRTVRGYMRFYDDHAVVPDYTAEFVYLALHFQPEASSVPMAGAYANQLLIANMLSAHLPEGVMLYIKEHPRESGWLLRSVDYYKDLLSLKNVRLIARDVDTFFLREHSSAVATGTGSVGFEALFREKPVLMFGHRFYQYASGVYRIRSSEDCINAIRSIFEKKEKPTLKEARLYLKAMEKTRIHGTLNPWDYKASRRSFEEHVHANASAISQEIQKIYPREL